MAHFDEKNGQVILSEEDKSIFKEINSRFTPNGIKTPEVDNIMKWVREGKTNG